MGEEHADDRLESCDLGGGRVYLCGRDVCHYQADRRRISERDCERAVQLFMKVIFQIDEAKHFFGEGISIIEKNDN